ncbi:hypothetical protein ACFYNO_18525 [Kitasatospora sp. NPDC006697]|uniref:hypothetical protein n=1 Tax=Kitasatospora sp. NPDC006697 TaxID=3364020 RepID=UPI0036BE6FBE
MTGSQDAVPPHLAHTARLLPDALEEAAGCFPTHRPDLVARAVTRGRRQRRVRQAQLSGVAALLLVGAGLLTVPGAADGGGAVRPAPAAPPQVTPEPPLPTPSPTPAPSTNQADFVPTQQALAQLLPERGTVSGLEGFGGVRADHTPVTNNPGFTVGGTLDFTDARGTTHVVFGVLDQHPEPALHNCKNWPAANCRTLADGTVVQEDLAPPDGTALYHWVVVAFHPDGREVRLLESAPDATHPLVLSPDEARAVVLNPEWGK